MLKGTIKKTFITFLSSLLLILIVPFNYIKADTQNTYYEYEYQLLYESNGVNHYGYKIDNLSNDFYYYFENSQNYNFNKCRGYVFKWNNSYILCIMLENTSSNGLNYRKYKKSNNAVLEAKGTTRFNNNNHTGYYIINGSNEYLNYIELGNISNNALNTALYSYLWGDNAIAPAPEVNYGNVADVKFTTSFVSQSQTAYNQSMPYNKDTISWNIAKSDNGTDLYYSELIDSWNVEIRANRFYYAEATKNDLLQQQLQDMNILNDQFVTLGTYPLINGSVSFTWGEVASAFVNWSGNSFFDSLWVNLVGSEYLTYGWYYEIRLVNSSLNYEAEWKKIYNITATPSTSDTILTNYYEDYNYDYNYNIQNTYQTINEMNGDNSIYYLNSDVVYYNQTDDYTFNNNVVNNFSEIVNEVKEKEDDFNQTLDENLTDIDLNEFDLTQWGNSFQNSAEWVKTQFNRMTIDKPVGSYLGFTLVVGLGLLIIGRIF